MKSTYTTSKLASALGLTPRAIGTRAKKAGWVVAEQTGTGKGWREKSYLSASLPAEVRDALTAYEGGNLPVETSETALTEDQRRGALARADLVRLYTEALAKAPRKGPAGKEFVAAYRAGVWPKIKNILGDSVSIQSLERWKLKLRRTGSALALADTRGGVRVEPVLTVAHQTLIVNLVRHPNQPNIAEVCRDAVKSFKSAGLPLCSEITIRRYIEKWISENYGEFVYARKGKKGWVDDCCPYIERDYSKIQVGDILVADGHVLNFEILDPETGKGARMELVLWYDMKSSYPLGWEILPTENTQAIASALRRACLRLGKFPRIAYLDNGRAFKGKFFMGVDFKQTGLGGVFQELGIAPMIAEKYHGQSKTIERFFASFGELERWCPSYVGTCIENKPPRLKRGEELHRRLYEASGYRPLTIPEAHTAIAMWFDEYARRPQRGHLNGQAPIAVFTPGAGPGLTDADLLKLRLCMLSKAVRQIEQNGVKIFGRHYRHPFLHSLRHPVLVRYDDQDRRSVLVYDETGKRLICEATPVPNTVHPAAGILGTEEDKALLASEIAYKKALENQVTANAREFLKNVVLPETQHRMRLVAEQKAAPPALPEPPAPNVKSIEAAKSAARAKLAAAPAYVPPAQMTSIVTGLDRYEYLFNVSVRDGMALREADADWMARYEQTEEYAACARGRFEGLRRVYARRRMVANGEEAS